MTGFRIRANIRSSVWFLPVLCVLAGVLLSFGTIAVDRIVDFSLVPQWLTGGPDAAMAILETIATAEVTLVTLVLTVTMVVVQLAMGQFSPRIVATFLRDKPSQLAIGLFVATFAHAILAMREVDFDEKQVPGVAVVVAYVLVVMSIGLLVVYVDHIGKSLRVSSLIELVGSATRETMDRRYPDRGDAPPVAEEVDGGRTIRAPHSGVLTSIDEPRLVAAAQHARCVIEVHPPLGAFVPAGAALCGVREGGGEALREDEVLAALQLGQDRSLDQDVAYGLRMLVDIGASPPSSAPTTTAGGSSVRSRWRPPPAPTVSTASSSTPSTRPRAAGSGSPTSCPSATTGPTSSGSSRASTARSRWTTSGSCAPATARCSPGSRGSRTPPARR